MMRSSDSGLTWQSANTGLTDSMIFGLLATSNYVLAAGQSGNTIYRSTNNGDSWSVIANGLPYCFTIVQKGTTLFATSQGEGVQRSTDDGLTWAKCTNGLSGLNNGLFMQSLTVFGSTLIGGTTNGTIFTSTDDGDHWTEMTTLAQGSNRLVPHGATVLNATMRGVWASTDAGATWKQFEGVYPGTTMALAATNKLIFAGVGNTLYGSTDDGLTWGRPTNGLTDSTIYGLAIK